MPLINYHGLTSYIVHKRELDVLDTKLQDFYKRMYFHFFHAIYLLTHTTLQKAVRCRGTAVGVKQRVCFSFQKFQSLPN